MSILVPRTFTILGDAVESGIAMGYARAFKHDDDPSSDVIKQSIYEEVINSIFEVFELKDQDDN
jgi:hypothetical protein